MSNQENTSWTINISASASLENKITPLIKQFTAEIEAIGGQCQSNHMQISGLNMSNSRDIVEKTTQVMRQQGMPEEEIQRHIKVVQAQMGHGSWADVVADQENLLGKYTAENNHPQIFGTVMALIKNSMNMGDHEKAVGYFHHAEQMFDKLPLKSLLNLPPDYSITPEQLERHQNMYQAQLDQLRNWLNL